MQHPRFILALAMTFGLLFALLAPAEYPGHLIKPGWPGGSGGGPSGPPVQKNATRNATDSPQHFWPWSPTSQPVPPTAIPPTAKGKVVCAVYYQPSYNFAMLKARGINALMGFDHGANNSMDAWCALAQQAGLKYYLQCFQTTSPGAAPPVLPLVVDPVAMAHQNDANLLGYLMPDEPNGVGNLTAAQCQALYQAVKVAAPKVPVVINLDGGHIMQFGQAGTAPYLAACDIACFDHYPENYGSQDIPNLKVIATDLKTWSGGKPVIEIFEAGDMNIKIQGWCAGTPLAAKMRGPTGGEMRSQVTTAHAGGVSGICWFQDRIGIGFENYDGTNADEQAAMLSIDSALQFGKW